MDNGAEEDRERDGSTLSNTTWRTCSSTWRMPRIELNGEGEPVWLTPHLRDPQPEGERERERKSHMGFPLTPRSMTLDDLELL